MNLNPNAIPANIAKCMPAAVRKSLHAETVEELAQAIPPDYTKWIADEWCKSNTTQRRRNDGDHKN